MRKNILLIFLLAISMLLTACSGEDDKEAEDLPENNSELEQKDIDAPGKLLEQIVLKAERGMIASSPFNVLDSTISQVKEQWEDPDNTDEAGHGFYSTYDQQHSVIGFNAEGNVFDLRSNDKELNAITSAHIEQALGKPAEIREGNMEKIYIYPVADKIQLKFIIPDQGTSVNHISVFNTELAQSQPYTLEIKGNSNQLTAAAWESMRKWRSQIVQFAEQQENMYIHGPNQKMIALTFDDGPDGEVTPAIIDILKAEQVTGNFFFLGREAEKHPDVVKTVYENGNLILSHSYRHVDLTKLTKQEQLKELKQAASAIEAIIGKAPAMMRPPYGETDEKLAAAVREEGSSIVLWSIDTLDWSQMEADNIVKNAAENLRNGDIILMHSDADKRATAEALPRIIEAIKSQHIEIVGLDELLDISAYK